MSIIYITHNLAVVSEIADEIAVMYLGHVMEHARVDKIVKEPLHPYTKALWRSIPKIQGQLLRLVPITGNLPSPFGMPEGCPFCTRCEEVIPGVCEVSPPALVDVGGGHRVSCFHYPDPAGTAGTQGAA